MRLFKKMGMFLTTGVLALGVGLTLGTNLILEAKGEEALNYSTGFESGEGFTTSTVYNNTTERVQGPTDYEWGTIMGTATTTAPLAGSQQIQLRSYAGNSTIGMAYPKFSFANLTRVTFATKAYAAGSTMTVEYSLNNSTWAAMTLTGTYSTTASTIEAAMPAELSGNQPTVYFRINHTLINAANRMYIDTVKVYVDLTFGTLDHIAVYDSPNKFEYFVGETFSSTGLVLVGYDDENEEIANTTMYYSGFTTDYDSHVFTAEEIGIGITVTVTYSEKTTTFPVDVYAVPTSEYTLLLTGADDFNTTSYAANNGEHSKNSADAVGSIGYYTNAIMQNSTNPVMQWQATNAYMYNTTDFVAIHSIVIRTGATAAAYANNLVVKEGASIQPSTGSTITADQADTTYTYTFSSGKGFFYIANGGSTTYIDSIEIIPVDARSDAVAWANGFLTSTGGICQSNGSTNLTDLGNAWTTLDTSYGNLSADAKNYFYTYADTAIVSAKERYTYIVNKYSLTNYIKNYSGTLWLIVNPAQVTHSSPSTNIHLIVAIALIGFSIVGAAFYLRKRKEI
ncbi:MAG: hypothetical protein WC344_04730 [Bacilli bacterium]|jgi:hypothetical protein